ncbi:MAG: hypothetical protein KDB48_00630 [Solirubrobacterales bacterium]|nr:hypothetical protein [Solirubrobacterales bacterium]HMT04257.1 hypothetical protein [Solirubrobacterales bacterium]
MEQLTGAPVLVEPHGFFSAGTLLGALLGILLTSTGFPVMAHFLAVVAISIPALAWAIAGISGRLP